MPLMTDPAYGAIAITPSDSTMLSGVRALYIGGSGNVAVTMRGSAAPVVFVGLTPGAILQVQAVKVMASDTTATDIVALY